MKICRAYAARAVEIFGGTTEIQKEVILRDLGLWFDQDFSGARAP